MRRKQRFTSMLVVLVLGAALLPGTLSAGRAGAAPANPPAQTPGTGRAAVFSPAGVLDRGGGNKSVDVFADVVQRHQYSVSRFVDLTEDSVDPELGNLRTFLATIWGDWGLIYIETHTHPIKLGSKEPPALVVEGYTGRDAKATRDSKFSTDSLYTTMRTAGAIYPCESTTLRNRSRKLYAICMTVASIRDEFQKNDAIDAIIHVDACGSYLIRGAFRYREFFGYEGACAFETIMDVRGLWERMDGKIGGGKFRTARAAYDHGKSENVESPLTSGFRYDVDPARRIDTVLSPSVTSTSPKDALREPVSASVDFDTIMDQSIAPEQILTIDPGGCAEISPAPAWFRDPDRIRQALEFGLVPTRAGSATLRVRSQGSGAVPYAQAGTGFRNALDGNAVGPNRDEHVWNITCDPPVAECQGLRATIVGSDGDDAEILGTDGPDVIQAKGGMDFVRGLGGDDVICGGDGIDRLLGDTGDDTLYGEAGAPDVLFGGDGNDALHADIGGDTLWGDAGKDRLYGADGDDVLSGGDDDDALYGGAGSDDLSGDAGNDLLDGEAGFDGLSGGDGNDALYADIGGDSLNGDAGNDRLYGAGGVDELFGGDGDDTLFGEGGDDPWLVGGNGIDTVYGGDGDDALYGYGGNDTLYGEAGNDLLWGYEGNDTLDGGDGNDNLDGFQGDDQVVGGEGDDTLIGGEFDVGNDTLDGGGGHDALYGLGGVDQVVGGSGNDDLWGGTEDDTLNSVDGVFGNDSIDGEQGIDQCSADISDTERDRVVNCP